MGVGNIKMGWVNCRASRRKTLVRCLRTQLAMCPQTEAQRIVDRLAGSAAQMTIRGLNAVILPGAFCAQRVPNGKPLNTPQEGGDARPIAGKRGRKAHNGSNLPGQTLILCMCFVWILDTIVVIPR